MFQQDWRDALGSLADTFPNNDADGTADANADTDAVLEPSQTTPVHIALERKGRAGKTATILFGFTIPEEDIKELAAEIKRALGCGGSARGGEILIQGDRVAECKKFLSDRGFKIK